MKEITLFDYTAYIVYETTTNTYFAESLSYIADKLTMSEIQKYVMFLELVEFYLRELNNEE